MRFKNIPIASLTAIFPMIVFVFSTGAKEWYRIKPLHTSRADVERILGVKSSGANAENLSIGVGQMRISYTQGQCGKDMQGWKVPPGTVLYWAIRFYQGYTPSELGFDLTKFTLKRTDVESTILYEDENEGLELVVSGDKIYVISSTLAIQAA